MKQNHKSIKERINLPKNGGFLLVAVVLVLGMLSAPYVLAATLQEQINELSSDNSEIQQDVGDLEDEATSLKDKISRLQQRINGIQGQINENRSKIAEIKGEIKKAQIELDHQRDLLGQNIRAMYLEGEISTLEMLASSKDLSDFVDKQQYRNSVQSKIKVTLEKINKLKDELNDKKTVVEQRLKEQEALNSELSAKRSENNSLLNLNAGEQARLDSKIKKNNKKIEELKRLQFLENARRFGGGGGLVGGGGYPWGKAKCLWNGTIQGYCPNYDWAVGGQVNNWSNGGYAYRNCTDWVAWRVKVSGRNVPSGLGHASSWDDRAPYYGFKVSSTPKKGAAAVSNGGTYGHVMYVEEVNPDGTIFISDYNRAGPGEYGTSTISPSGLRFVYF